MRSLRLVAASTLMTLSLPIAWAASSMTLQKLTTIVQANKRAMEFSLKADGAYEGYGVTVTVKGKQGSTESNKDLTFDVSLDLAVTTPKKGLARGTVDLRLVDRTLYARLYDIRFQNTEGSFLDEDLIDEYANTWYSFPLDEDMYSQLTKEGKTERASKLKALERFVQIVEQRMGGVTRYTLSIPAAKQRGFLNAVMKEARSYSPRAGAELRRYLRSTKITLDVSYDITTDNLFDAGKGLVVVKTGVGSRAVEYRFDFSTKVIPAPTIVAPAGAVPFDLLEQEAQASLGEARNAQRRSDLMTILGAIYQYSLDNKGKFPATIPTTPVEICVSEKTSNCASLVNLNALIGVYLFTMPGDPQSETLHGTRYFISKDANGLITVTAPDAEEGVTLSITR